MRLYAKIYHTRSAVNPMEVLNKIQSLTRVAYSFAQI